MSYSSALHYVLSLQNRGIKLDLDRMRRALADLESPEKSYPIVLVAGTNGKGSTSSAIASIASRPGRRVGLFTSPHLVDYRERFRIDGVQASRARLAEIIESDREVWDRHELTFFEATAALALSLFRAEEMDLVILEVGLGGRLDATNTVEPSLSVITQIGRDHVHILGNELGAIALEKAGILRSGVPSVIAGGYPEAVHAISSRARELGSPLFMRPRCLEVREIRAGADGSSFRVRSRSRDELGHDFARSWPAHGLDLQLGVVGRHQVSNAALAALATSVPVPALGGAPIATPEEIRRGLYRWRWPGRLDRPRRDLPLLFDCGHNREAGRALAVALRKICSRRGVELVVGMLAKKDHLGFFREMRAIADRVTIAPPATPRAAEPSELLAAAQKAGFEVRSEVTVADGIDYALSIARDPEGPIAVLAGSLFTLEEGYRHLGVSPAERLWESSKRGDTVENRLSSF